MVGGFLDQISSFAHILEDGRYENESWRNTLVQPVQLPDFEHVQVSTRLLTTAPAGNDDDGNASLWYPDGSVALQLREQISKQVQLTVEDVNVDHDDVRIRDLVRRKRKKEKKRRNL
jgi:hypothetical protein